MRVSLRKHWSPHQDHDCVCSRRYGPYDLAAAAVVSVGFSYALALARHRRRQQNGQATVRMGVSLSRFGSRLLTCSCCCQRRVCYSVTYGYRLTSVTVPLAIVSVKLQPALADGTSHHQHHELWAARLGPPATSNMLYGPSVCS